MKKALFISLLALVLCFSCAMAEETVFTFDDGANPGFFQSGSCSVSVKGGIAHSGDLALAVYRTQHQRL